MTASSMTVRQARDAYFAASGFDESSYSDDWVDIRLGRVPFRFPNSKNRKKVIPLHDLHHSITGYDASFRGEVQIAAWEIGGGMRHHWIGWFLNLLAMSWGTFVYPRVAFRAFVRGRRSVNLYQRAAGPDLLEQDLATVRTERSIEQAPPARFTDAIAFAGWAALSWVVGLIGVACMPLMAILGLWGTMTAAQAK